MSKFEKQPFKQLSTPPKAPLVLDTQRTNITNTTPTPVLPARVVVAQKHVMPEGVKPLVRNANASLATVKFVAQKANHKTKIAHHVMLSKRKKMRRQHGNKNVNNVVRTEYAVAAKAIAVAAMECLAI